MADFVVTLLKLLALWAAFILPVAMVTGAWLGRRTPEPREVEARDRVGDVVGVAR